MAGSGQVPLVPVCEGVLVTQTALPITLIAAALSTDSQGQGHRSCRRKLYTRRHNLVPLYTGGVVKDKNE